MEDGPLLPLPPTLEPISRPSSTSTSASLPQLPGISSLASASSATSSPQMRPAMIPPMYTGSSPAATTGGGGTLPTCQNCATSTTPLWRRDEFGSVLCNACGLFLKLHGRPRPISLKTDVIKSRNRVKTIRPDLAKKKPYQVQPQQPHPSLADPNGVEALNHAAAAVSQAARRASQKSANGHTEGSRSPVSRTGTPSIYTSHGLPMFQSSEDGHYPITTQASLASGRAASPLKGEARLDVPQSYDQLIAVNSSLTTRVNELDFINGLLQNEIRQLQPNGANGTSQAPTTQADDELRARLEASEKALAELQSQLEDSHRRENNLKRRLDEMEVELKDAREHQEKDSDSERPAKRLRVSDMVEESEVSTPQSTV